MRDTDLFQMAPGLTPPWQVASCEFVAEQKCLDIRLAFPRGSVFSVRNAVRQTSRHTTPRKRAGGT